MVQRTDAEMGADLFRVRGIFHSIAPAIGGEGGSIKLTNNCTVRSDTGEQGAAVPSVASTSGCSFTLPCQAPDTLPVGLMLSAPAHHDAALAGVALAVEALLQSS